MGPLVSILGLILGVAGLFLHSIAGWFIATALIIVGIVLVIVGLVMFMFSFYRRTSADQAFVRTGMGGSRVVLDGGIPVIPGFHRVLEINLKTMKLGVNPRGPNALITHDNLRANVLAQFYIRVQADTEHILNAARSLGESSVNAEAVEALVSEKLVSALRAIASQMDLFEIHTKRDEFAEKVKEHVKSDLEANGLLLESVTISELDQTDPGELSDNNVFDAQGKRKITEITAAAQVERNTLEREAERAKKQKDVDTRRQVLELERQQAEAEAQQATQIATVKAEQERSAQEAVIIQQRQVELAKIEKEKQIQAQDIARNQAVEIAKMQQEQAVQTAAVERDQKVALADRARQIAVAQQETVRAKAEEQALTAEAERQRAEQQVTTVIQIAEAEREANKKLIGAKQQIEQDKLRLQTNADVEAYSKVKMAEGEKEAAEKQAAAKMQIATAEAQSKEMVARGEKAQQMVAVEVSREQVGVEQAKVAVERQQLENRQEFAEAGIQLEVRRLSIQADRDVQIEFAKSLASFMANGHMTLYGTPETATTMLSNMAKGFGLRAAIDGFVSGQPTSNGHVPGGNGNAPPPAAPAGDPVGALIGQLGSLLAPAIGKLTGGDASPKGGASSEKIARELASDPAFVEALRKAMVQSAAPIHPAQQMPPAPAPAPVAQPLVPIAVTPAPDGAPAELKAKAKDKASG